MENSALHQQIEAIREEIKASSEKLDSSKLVYELRKSFLDNKTGKISALMKEMKNIAAEDRAEYGKNVNELKTWALEQFEELDKKMKEKELKARYEKEKQDVTMPAKMRYQGNLHPVTQMRETLIDIFAGMGFEIYEGTEIENRCHWPMIQSIRLFSETSIRVHKCGHSESVWGGNTRR